MLKIGEFSKLSRVSVRMLRHYDEVGLLAPSEVDPMTGYRYYSERQLITAGLQKDDVVVVEGMQKAGEGKTVKVQQAAAPSAGAAAEQPAN